MAFDLDKWIEKNRETEAPLRPQFDLDNWMKQNESPVQPEKAASEPSTPAQSFDLDNWMQQQEQGPSPARQAVERRHGIQPEPATSLQEPQPEPAKMTPESQYEFGRQRLEQMRQKAAVLPEGSPERTQAEADYAKLTESAGRLRSAMEAADVSKGRERAIRGLAYGLREAAGGVSFGVSDVVLAKIAKDADLRPESTPEMIAAGVTRLLGNVLTGRTVAGGMKKLTAKYGIEGVKALFAIRGGTALVNSGLNSLSQYLAGNATLSEAIQNTAVGIVSTMAGTAPELGIRQGVGNFVGQVLTDFAVDIGTDKLRGRLEDRSFADWFFKEELQNLAMSIMFAAADWKDKDFERNRKSMVGEVRSMFRKHVAKVEARAAQGGQDAEAVRGPEAEVQPEAGGEDLRGQGQVEGGEVKAVEEPAARLTDLQASPLSRLPNGTPTGMPEPPAPREAPEAPRPPEASPAEPARPEGGEEIHGPRNIIINRQREQMGLPPRDDPVAKALPESYEGANRRLAEDPAAVEKLMDDLQSNPRPHTDEEVGVLGIGLVNRKHDWHRAMDAYSRATDANRGELFAEVERAAQRYRELADVVQRAGTETARGLVARRMLIRDDLSLEDMIFERQAMKGEPLSRNEYDAIRAEHDKMVEADRAVTRAEDARTTAGVESFIRDSLKTAEEAPSMEDARTALAEKGLGRKQLRDLARAHISNGVTEVVDLTLRLRQDIIDITGKPVDPTSIREMLSNYGKVSRPSQDDVEKRLRELTAVSRLISATEDALAGNPPKKTGPQRDKPSAPVREQMRTLRDVMRENGIEATGSRETKLASRLQAMKTRLQNRVEDLNRQIAAGMRMQPERTPIAMDAEAKSLKKEVQRLEDVLTDLERASGALNDRAERRMLAALDRRIARYLQSIETGDVGRKAKTGAASPYSKPISERQAIAKLLREEVAAFRKERAMPKATPDQKALAALKKRIASQTAELQRRLSEGDFEPKKKEKPQIRLDKDAAKAQAELNKLKVEYARRTSKYEYDRMSPTQKTGYHLLSVVDMYRTLASSYDFSALRRQGGMYILGHPIKGLRAAKMGAIAWKSDAEMARMMDEIRSRRNYDKYQKYKIGLTDMEGAKAEEIFAVRQHGIGRVVEKMPGVPASQRAYTATLNRNRADLFDSLEAATSVRKGGLPLTDAEYKAIAEAVRNVTGRATAGRADRAIAGLNTVLWAPRLLLSRIKYLTKLPGYVAGSMVGDSKAVNRAITAEMLRQAAGLAAYYVALSLYAGSIPEEDPRATKFGRITLGKNKNIVLDPLAGLGQVITFAFRLITGKRKLASGKVVEERGPEVTPFQRTTGDTIGQFVRSKLNPATGMAYSIATRRDYLGNYIDNVPEYMLRNAVPLAARDIMEVMQEEGIPEGLLPSILAIIGEGVQVWNDKKKTSTSTTKLPQMPSKLTIPPLRISP